MNFVLALNDPFQEVDLHVSCLTTGARAHSRLTTLKSTAFSNVQNGRRGGCVHFPLLLLLLRWLIIEELLALDVSHHLAFDSG